MDERRKRLLGEADDADVRGEHRYPDEPEPEGSGLLDRGADADEALTREPCQYVAGAEGTQLVTTPRRRG